MRLSDTDIMAIKKAVGQFDDTARIFLFGSRVDDYKKGGDIDLLVLSDTIGRMEKRKIKFCMADSLGEQKIDLLVAADLSDPFVRIAKGQGVEL